MSSTGFLNCGSSGQHSAVQSEKVVVSTMSSLPVFKEIASSKATLCSPFSIVEPFVASDWDSLGSVPQNVDFNGSTTLSSYESGVLENQAVDCAPTCFVEQNTRLSCLNNDMHSSNEHGVDNDSKGKKKKRRMPECGAFDCASPVIRIQNSESGQQKDLFPESNKGPVEMEERKQRAESNPGSSSRKLSKQSKENCQNGDTPKEEWMHLRAKRGHATNSHSLAERVRREKISERMRLLQDLVPGCNKITGKAVMLDEIINYVQSLQRQVEFLSMKLAAVNPEINFDIEHILSNDIFHSRDGNLAALGFSRGMSSSDPRIQMSTRQGVMQADMAMCSLPGSGEVFKRIAQIPPMAQILNAWDDELQNVIQMGFPPNTPLDCTELQGSMKLKL